MRRRLRGVSVAIAAGVLCVSCLLPTFQIAVEAFVGAGSAQRSFRYERQLSIVPDSGFAGALVLAAGLTLFALGVAGAARGWDAWPSAASLVVALGLLVLVFDTEDHRLGWPGPHGVIGHEEKTAGPLLARGLDDLKRDAGASREAAEPGWTLSGGEHGYAARGLSGWSSFLWATLALCWLTGYGVIRLRLGPWASAGTVAAVSFFLLVWLVLRGLAGD
jgi:hypothetical protein